MSTEYSDKINNKIKASAIKAFELLKEEPESATKQAEESRSTLYAWLIAMQQFTEKPLFTFDDQDVAVFEAATAKGGVKAGLSAVLANKTKDLKGVLVSRQDKNFLWEQTGFHVDLEVKGVFAKVGKHGYQPIGFDNGTAYIPLEGSKTLWTREFALALLQPLEPAFKIENREDRKEADFAKAFMSEDQVAVYREAIEWFDTDLAEMRQLHAAGGKETEISVLETKMKETIKLARIRIPQLDAKLSEMEAKFGDAVMSDMFKYVTACREFLDLHLNENEVRKKLTTTELLNRDGSDTKASTAILKSLEPLLDQEGKLTVDDDTAASSLSAAMVAIPTLRVVVNDLGKDAPLSAGLSAAIKHLKAG
jgi:hypothetical protein